MEEAKAKAEAVLAAYAEGRSFEESAGDGTIPTARTPTAA